jgi:hypothetical protein
LLVRRSKSERERFAADAAMAPARVGIVVYAPLSAEACVTASGGANPPGCGDRRNEKARRPAGPLIQFVLARMVEGVAAPR